MLGTEGAWYLIQFFAYITVVAVQRAVLVGLFGVAVDDLGGKIYAQQCSCTGHTTAGTGHAFQQIPLVLSCLGKGHQLAAIPQTFGSGSLNLGIGIGLVPWQHHRIPRSHDLRK